MRKHVHHQQGEYGKRTGTLVFQVYLQSGGKIIPNGLYNSSTRLRPCAQFPQLSTITHKACNDLKNEWSSGHVK